jgi:DUF4097 and DUF4098 domain-containing protein YvlB
VATIPPYTSPGDARRAARAAQRFQRAQMRMQMRTQAAMLRRPSLAGPVLLVAVGVVALLLETGTLSPGSFWPWYSTWWPLVLIGLGLVLLLEYFLDRARPYAGRRHYGGFAGLVVALSLMGIGSHKVFAPDTTWGEPFTEIFGGNEDWMGLRGQEHTHEVNLSETFAPTGALSIHNARGDVHVLASDQAGSDRVEIAAEQTVHAHNSDGLDKSFAALQPRWLRSGTGATIEVDGRDNAEVDLRVTVPPGVAVSVQTAHGDISVAGLRASVAITNSHGGVTADDLGGSLTAQMDRGDVTLHDVAGDVAINGAADDVAISGVRGRTLMNGDFFGDTRVSDVSGSVHFHSSHTDLQVGKLAGELSLDHGDLGLDNASGGVQLRADAKDVDIKNLAGDAEIDDGNGDIDLVASAPLGNLRVHANTGSVSVTVPRTSSFSVQASTNDSDDLSSDFPGSTETNSGRKTFHGAVGQGGPHLTLTADHGDLTLQRGDAADATPPPPLATPNTAPSGHTRHLHAAPGEVPSPSVQ